VGRSPPGDAFFRPFQELKAKGKPSAASTKKTKQSAAEAKAPAETAAKKTLGAAHTKQASAPVDEATAPPTETQTFAMYMAGVRALEDGVTRIPLTASRVERTARSLPVEDLDADARAKLRSLVIEGIRFEMIDDGDHIEGRRIDVDHRELRRLRRGQYAIDGKLDLHGLNAEEARRAVESFVRKRATDGDKVVMIIHGKGSHSPRQQGVLRGEIGAWLSQGRSARHIRAFTTAPDDEGGTGALLVLLAR